MIKIKFEKENNKSVAYDENVKIGECVFVETKEFWNIVHTEVSSLYQGQGIARKLVENIIENAKKYNKTLIAECSYANEIIKSKKMNNIYQYYENTKNAPPNKNVREFMKLRHEEGNAIELGCGAGRDTKFLLENKWNVLAIDKEDVSDIIKEKLNIEELKRFKFKKQEFESLQLESNNLIVANYSLSFCKEEKFVEMWDKIKNSILPNGYFVGNFFGTKDEWAKTKEHMTFLSKENCLNLFNEFDIISFKEIEKQGLTGLGEMKRWHIFDVIAKKK